MGGCRTVYINRAPLLTLWAAVVAERLGFRRDEALTLGRAVAGLNAYCHRHLRSMIVNHSDVIGVTIDPFKNDAPLIVDLESRKTLSSLPSAFGWQCRDNVRMDKIITLE